MGRYGALWGAMGYSAPHGPVAHRGVSYLHVVLEVALGFEQRLPVVLALICGAVGGSRRGGGMGYGEGVRGGRVGRPYTHCRCFWRWAGRSWRGRGGCPHIQCCADGGTERGTDGRTDGWRDGGMEGRTDRGMGGGTDGRPAVIPAVPSAPPPPSRGSHRAADPLQWAKGSPILTAVLGGHGGRTPYGAVGPRCGALRPPTLCPAGFPARPRVPPPHPNPPVKPRPPPAPPALTVRSQPPLSAGAAGRRFRSVPG